MAEGAEGEAVAGRRRLIARPTLDEIFAEPDEFGLLDVKPALASVRGSDRSLAALAEVTRFQERNGRLPDPDAIDNDEMRLGTILAGLRRSPTPDLLGADRLGVLDGAAAPAAPRTANWREEPLAEEVPESLDDIFADDDLDIDEDAVTLRHATPAAGRHTPDHRAEFVPCRDFETFQPRFEEMQGGARGGERKAVPVRKWAVIEPQEGDFVIRVASLP